LEENSFYPTLIHLQDLIECGKVYQCLINNPGFSDKEVAEQTGLPPKRISSLRTYLEHEHKIPKQRKVIEETIRKPTPLTEKSTNDQILDNNVVFPVRLDMEYTGRIENTDQTGSGIVLVNNFICLIPGAKIGELVKFQVEEIKSNSCEAKLIRVLQKSPAEQVNEQEISQDSKQEIGQEPLLGKSNESQNKETIALRCRICYTSITLEDSEKQDGLCSKCWGQEALKEFRKNMRRSGMYGADRAGTF